MPATKHSLPHHSLDLNAKEPDPQPNINTAIWDLVIADMRSRDNGGHKKYATRLQAFNGRDALVDAYQEALDLAVYLRQAIEERRQELLSIDNPPFDSPEVAG